MNIPRLLTAGLLMAVLPAQAQNTANSLLWRISGNGMAKPSYLFGTIHLQAKKLFNFPDSLYTAIDNTDVFALEINPDSMNSGISAYMTKVMDDAEKKEQQKLDKKPDRKLKELLTREELKTLREYMPENSGIDPEELTVKQVYMMKDKLSKHKARKDDMPTFMDAYLFTIARDKDKMMSGLEHLSDQINLMDSMDMSGVDPEKMVAFFKQGETAEDKLVEFYMNRDLESLQKFSQILPEKQERVMLRNRNKIMLRSMDSIMQLHSLFCAVGALHLPGRQGLISLLKEEGYTVEPVICSTYTNGADYNFKKKTQTWVTMASDKDGYSIKMPGEPSDVDAYGGTVKMKMFYDMGTSTCYLVSHIARPSGGDESTESVIDAMAKAMTKNAPDVEEKSIQKEGLQGKEYFFIDKDANHYHLQLMASRSDVYILAAYAKSWSVRKADSFFNTFTLTTKVESKQVVKTFADALISVSVPESKPVKSVNYAEDSTQKQTIYSITDPAAGEYYFVVCNQTAKGFNYNNDTTWIQGLRDRFSPYGATLVHEPAIVDGHNAESFVTSKFSGMKIKGMMVYCGNRVYKLMAQVTDNEKGLADADHFLSSIKIIAPPPDTIRVDTAANGAFSAMVPGPLTAAEVSKGEDENDTLRPLNYAFQSEGPNSLLNYLVTVKRLNSYYWKSADTVMLKAWMQKRVETNDTTPVYTYFVKDGIHYGEARASKKFTRQEHRIRVVEDGRTRYILECTYPAEMAGNKQINDFFTSFSVLKKDPGQLRSSPAQFLADMHSADTTLHNRAEHSSSEVYFGENDLPLLLHEYESSFPDDTSVYGRSAAFFYQQIELLADQLTIPQIEALYRYARTHKRSQQCAILQLLTNQKDTVVGFAKLKELMLTEPPHDGFSYLLSYRLKRSAALTATLYPELLQLAGDSVSGYLVCDVAEYLLDSGYIKPASLAGQVPMLLEKSRQLHQQTAPLPAFSLMKLLMHFPSPQVWDEVAQYQFAKDNMLRYDAVKLMADSMRKPAAVALDSLAADDAYRIELYNLLKTDKMLSLFPAKYRTQQYFAQAYAAMTGDEDFPVTVVRSLGARKEMYQDKKQKFYLFELKSEADTLAYLGIAGPFSDDMQKVLIDDDANASGLYTDPLDKGNLDNQLKLYLIKKKIDEMPAAAPVEE